MGEVGRLPPRTDTGRVSNPCQSCGTSNSLRAVSAAVGAENCCLSAVFSASSVQGAVGNSSQCNSPLGYEITSSPAETSGTRKDLTEARASQNFQNTDLPQKSRHSGGALMGSPGSRRVSSGEERGLTN